MGNNERSSYKSFTGKHEIISILHLEGTAVWDTLSKLIKKKFTHVLKSP